jgi:hypothetical protein
MAVSEQELNEALSRAASLMSPEGQRQIEFAGRQNRNNYGEDGSYFQPSGSQGMGRSSQSYTPKRQMNETKLPKAIIESIKNNPLDNVQSEYSTSGSILDSIDYTPKRREPIQETYVHETYTPVSQPVYQQPMYQPQQYQQPQQYMAQSMNIDYNYIRAIVNECVQANIQAIKAEILKESTLKTIRIGGENKIQLIDNKNNLYESRLEFKKNISKK